MAFPTSLDSFTTKVDNTDYVLAAHVNDLQSAIVAIETKLGVNSSAVNTTIDYLLKSSSSTSPGHLHAKGDAGLGNVDNTSDATKNSASVTLTNKRITQRVTTTTDDATAVIDIDACDTYQLSAVANATELSTTGTPTDGQKLIIRLKDAGVAKALTWTGFTAIGVTLPTTTVAGKWHYIGCVYNSAASAWHAIAVGVQA